MIITTNCGINVLKKRKERERKHSNPGLQPGANHSTNITCLGLAMISKNNNILVKLVQGNDNNIHGT